MKKTILVAGFSSAAIVVTAALNISQGAPQPERTVPISSPSTVPDNEANRKAAVASLPDKPTVSEMQTAISKYGASNVLWGVFYSDRFGYILKQIGSGDKQWYEVAKKLRWVSDAGASEQLDEALHEAEEKVPELDPTSPKVVFKGQDTDSFTGVAEAHELKVALREQNIPFTTQVSPNWETVSWPRNYSEQVRKIDEKYYCDPDIPEDRSFESTEQSKACLRTNGIAFTTAVCHKIEYVVVPEKAVKRVLGSEGLCRN